MERELLLEIGCEELPAGWLVPLADQLAARMKARLVDLRLSTDAPIEAHATPRRLAVVAPRIAERQTDLDEPISGPPVSAAFTPEGEPTPAALGFAKKCGVEVSELTRTETPKGVYLTYVKKQRGKTAVDVLPDLIAAVLRDLTFPKAMHWDAWIDDGKGELSFGRPIRWLLFLYGGRVVPFTIRRSAAASSSLVQDIRTGAITYGHRFLAVSGRPGRAVKVRSFTDYKARLAEHFVLLERSERHSRIIRELESHARRLGGRVSVGAISQSGVLQEVADLVEYPSVVAGAYSPEFLKLPEEVLTTTMIHHQHNFPVVDENGRLMPAFLAVTNIEVDAPRKIAVNAERVLTARLRDARFFWDADRTHPLASRLDRLDTLLFHKALGSYRAKASRLAGLAEWIAKEALGRPEAAADARTAGELAKADLVSDMVREFTELQGTMGGIYARAEGLPEPVWKAIYYQYQPVGVETGGPPNREQLGTAGPVWAAVSLADKIDSSVGLFAAGERPTGTRDPFGLRRMVQGALRVLVDLPEMAALDAHVDVLAVAAQALKPLQSQPGLAGATADAPFFAEYQQFVLDRLRYLFAQRGFRPGEVEAALGATTDGRLAPLAVRRRLEALQGMRGSEDFAALAVLFKRVKNIAREISDAPRPQYDATLDRARLTEPAEVALAEEFDRRAPAIRAALDAGHYRQAMMESAALRPAVDRFFTEVFVMTEDADVRTARLMLMVEVRDLVMRAADISALGG